MKSKFGIFDIIIIVLVICMGLIGFKVISGKSVSNTPKQEVAFTIELRGAEKELVDAIEKGDVIYNNSNNAVYGSIQGITIEPATELVTDLNLGEYKIHTYDELYDVYIDLKGIADSVSDKHITVAEEQLKIGSLAYISSNKFASSGYVVKIEREVK